MTAKTTLTLFLYVASTSALLRSAPVYESTESRLLRCGESVELVSNTIQKSDYGQWVRVKHSKDQKLKGWVLKDILTNKRPDCLFSHIPLETLNQAAGKSNEDIARQEELIIREQKDSIGVE